jgi:hypothetical protein
VGRKGGEVSDTELELMRVMHEPPELTETKDFGKWIAKLQSLSAEIRRAEKRRARRAGK